MKIKELIEALSIYDPDAEVYIAEPTGNYWRHVKVLPVDIVDELPIVKSEYTNTLVMDEGGKKCVVTIMQKGIY